MPDIADLSSESLWCRTERHRWAWVNDEPIHAAGRGRPIVAYVRHSECEACGATKRREIDITSWTTSNALITYPRGYLIRGSGRIDSREVLREQFTRASTRPRTRRTS